MAKATATCTCATCGKVFELSVTKYNRREADQWEQWAAENCDECPECRAQRLERERAQQNEQARAAAAERGWPELTGTEKQIAWANTLRDEQITSMLEHVRPADLELVTECVDEFLASHTKASWWIDNKDLNSAYRLIRDMWFDRKSHPELRAAKAQEKEAEAAAQTDEATIAEPENRTHDGIVEISAPEDRVTASYRKDDAFRELVKNLGYRWNPDTGKWTLKITVKTGSSAERAAELGNKLLNAGFAIRIQDPDTLQNAVAGKYEPMTYRWIARIADSDDFIITWGQDSFYDQARRLPGAKYDKPGIRVSVREYAAVLDFADTYGFRLTPGAQELIDTMTAARQVVTPAPARDAQYDEHPLGDVLNSSREIIDDLRDDA